MAAEEDVTMADVDYSTQWLVERARQSLKENNPYEAKAWLITAKTLYPNDFGVQVSLQCFQPVFRLLVQISCIMFSYSLKFLFSFMLSILIFLFLFLRFRQHIAVKFPL